MDETITIEIRLFARLRELCGDRPALDLEVPAGATTARCFEELCGRFVALAPYRDTLAVAVNDEYATWEHGLQAGDVVAFIPPVSGGSGRRSDPAAAPFRGDHGLRHSLPRRSLRLRSSRAAQTSDAGAWITKLMNPRIATPRLLAGSTGRPKRLNEAS